jgi:spermidine synthase
MLLHANPKDVLHICFGSGNSVKALTRHNPRRIDVVELSPHVRETAEYFWTNENVLDDPRVHLVIEDGRNFLLRTDRAYDVVSLEPPQVHSAGVVNLYTEEFYELVRGHLRSDGIVVQWLPTWTFSKKDRGHLIRAFTEAFPFVYVWQQLMNGSLLLMGTLEPLRVDVGEVDRRLRPPAMRRDAATMGTPTAEEFLSFFLLGDESTRKLVTAYEPVRDDRTIVDYSIPHYIGAGFGLDYGYPIGPDGFDVQTLRSERLREYETWQDPISFIIPSSEQARRVEGAMAKRRLGTGASRGAGLGGSQAPPASTMLP